MNTKITIFDNRYAKQYDVSELVDKIQWDTYMESQPGKCTLAVIKAGALAFWEGATITIEVGSKKIFKGFVFTKKRNKDTNIINVICYDQLRYLKNKDSYVFKNLTSSQIFSKLCDDFVLKYKVVDASTYICAPRVNDNKPLYEMIDTALSDTLINTKQWYIVRDNFGVLEHVNITSLKSGLILGDKSGVTDFDYTSSIDTDVYNQIKLFRDNTDTGKREIYIVNDTINGGKNLKEWGILQYYGKVDDTLNIAQIEARARGMLSLYNNVSRTLKLQCLGDFRIFAGASFNCQITDLGDLSISLDLLVNQCSHIIENNVHTMTIDVEVVT